MYLAPRYNSYPSSLCVRNYLTRRVMILVSRWIRETWKGHRRREHSWAHPSFTPCSVLVLRRLSSEPPRYREPFSPSHLTKAIVPSKRDAARIIALSTRRELSLNCVTCCTRYCRLFAYGDGGYDGFVTALSAWKRAGYRDARYVSHISSRLPVGWLLAGSTRTWNSLLRKTRK